MILKTKRISLLQPDLKARTSKSLSNPLSLHLTQEMDLRTNKDDDLSAGLIILGVKDASLIRYFQELVRHLDSNF